MGGGELNDNQYTPELSVVIPVFNEEKILRESLVELCAQLNKAGLRFEVVLAENGSSDRTLEIAGKFAEECREIRVLSYPEPNYGRALREGILRARGRFVVCEEIDLCDVGFHLRALEILRIHRVDMVIGSKAMPGSRDRRPWVRRLATQFYNALLRLTLGFHGTDTHGLKAFHREALAPVAASCIVEHDVFASEFVIRAERVGIRVVEIQIDLHEKRASSTGLCRRVPRVASNLARLLLAIHFGSLKTDAAPCPRPEE